MREMKESGIAWIGEIPKEWKIIRLRFLCDINTGNQDTINKVDEGLYPFFVRSPKVERINTYEYDGEAVLMAGDGVGAGKVFHYYNGKFNYHQRVYNFHHFTNVIGKFLFYYMPANFINKIEEGGAKSTVDSVRLPWLKDFPVCISSLSEQQRIATFLDEKCKEIDALIALQEEMITELQAYKQSVISEAVTKGLAPKVAMKDSGVAWIGEIPEHWEVCKIKNIFNLKTGTTPKSYDTKSDNNNYINWFTPSDIDDTHLILKQSQRQLAKEIADKDNICVYPKESLLLVGIGATAGKVGYLTLPGYSNQQITALIPRRGHSKYYLYYLFITKDIIRDNAFFTTLPIINNSYLSKIVTVCPPLPEQQAIADYLDTQCTRIDSLIALKQTKIESLKEYKKSVIYEYVTGKKEVPATV